MAARMIPSLGPADYDDRSREGEIYYALSKLPDDFTVIHSYKMLDIVNGNAIEQREADFIVFNRKLGILVIEAKTVSGCTVAACQWEGTGVLTGRRIVSNGSSLIDLKM